MTTRTTDNGISLAATVVNKNERITNNGQSLVSTIVNANKRTTDNSQVVNATVYNKVKIKMVIGYYSNGSYNDKITEYIDTTIDFGNKASVSFDLTDNGTEVKLKVTIFNRGNYETLYTNEFNVNELVGNGGGIGIISENNSMFDNLTIMYNK